MYPKLTCARGLRFAAAAEVAGWGGYGAGRGGHLGIQQPGGPPVALRKGRARNAKTVRSKLRYSLDHAVFSLVCGVMSVGANLGSQKHGRAEEKGDQQRPRHVGISNNLPCNPVISFALPAIPLYLHLAIRRTRSHHVEGDFLHGV
jgi:hypothetical protein